MDAKRMGAKNPKKQISRQGAKSIKELAAHVGRAPSAVHRWLHDERWPFASKAPWTAREIKQIKLWANTYLEPGRESDEEKRLAAEALDGIKRAPSPSEQAKLAYLVERAMMMKQRRLVESGKLHDVESCTQQRLRQIYEVKGRLLEMPRSMAHALVGKDAEAIEVILRKHVESIIAEFAGDLRERGNV